METTLSIPTPVGVFRAAYSDRGLARLQFPHRDSQEANQDSRNRPHRVVRQWHRLTQAAVRRILRGKEPGNLPPLDLSRGTDFQRTVWTALARISLGRTRSYGEVARAIGRPRAFRAVGSACGANPVPLIVPCHRVLAAGGQVGGFSSGLEWKKRLLHIEGVAIKSC
jgi:O-6-methylguanine DNA methyltransferase